MHGVPQTHRGFVADATLDHVLVPLPLHRDGALAHPAAHPHGGPFVGADSREGVGRRRLHHVSPGAGEGRLKV